MAKYSESVEDYLRMLQKLGMGGQAVAVSSLAEQLGLSKVSVHEMIRRLEQHGLIVYQPYRGVSLTKEGSAVAGRVTQRHRLWERFLYDMLELPWADVHDEADKLEHATTPDLTHRLVRLLDNPPACPHGHPILGLGSTYQGGQERSLSDSLGGEHFTIVRLPEHSRELLTYVDRLGLRPSSELRVLEVVPFGGPVIVEIQARRVAIGRDLASEIIVRST